MPGLTNPWVYLTDGGESGRQAVVLIATDDEWVVRAVESILTPQGYTVARARDAAEAIERTRSLLPEVVLLDVKLKGLSGIEVCRVLRSVPEIPRSTPLLLLTRVPPVREERVEALRAGAWDLLSMPFDSEEFLLKLESSTAATRDAREAWQAGLVDPATGLYNARGLVWRVNELAAEAARYHRPLACVALSPEQESHTGSTQERRVIATAVTRVADVMRRGSRGSDVLGRLTPQEFVIVLPDTSHTGGARVAERLAASADASTALALGGSASIRMHSGYYGVDDFGEANLEPVDLLTRATRALRRPRQGRGDDNGS